MKWHFNCGMFNCMKLHWKFPIHEQLLGTNLNISFNTCMHKKQLQLHTHVLTGGNAWTREQRLVGSPSMLMVKFRNGNRKEKKCKGGREVCYYFSTPKWLKKRLWTGIGNYCWRGQSISAVNFSRTKRVFICDFLNAPKTERITGVSNLHHNVGNHHHQTHVFCWPCFNVYFFWQSWVTFTLNERA